MGVPHIGCNCNVCRSKDPKNIRWRPSVLITEKKKRYLVDVGPDYRAQALKYKIDHLDGLLLTHTHYDHIAGLDELRIYTFVYKKPIPCLLSRESLEELKIRYHYFLPPTGSDKVHETKLHFQVLERDQGKTSFEGLDITYCSYDQLGMKVNGFRFGKFAYITDILNYKEEIFSILNGTKILVISGRRWEKSNAHISLEEGIEMGKKIGAKKTYFTHICHEIEHGETSAKLPDGFFLAYDGLEIGLS
jgi:phosphoribosyl 1,2-cyclic phosphate phosphodiesterase